VKTYSMNELMELTKLTARTVRNYTALGLIPKPRFAGAVTRYPRETLGKLVAIRTWQRNQKLKMPALQRTLREDDQDWDAWADDVDPVPVEAVPIAQPTPVVTAGAGLEFGEKWVQVPLIPGLMLMMRDGATEMTASVAREIQKRYRAG